MGDVVYLVSAAGHPNFGDEAIVVGWLRFLAGVRPEAVVVLDCPHPVSARVLFEDMHPHLLVTDALWRASARSPWRDAAGVWAFVESLVLSGTDADFEPLTRAGSIHLLGGGYINAIWPHQSGVVAVVAAAGHLTGAALYGTGLGLLPECQDLPRLAETLQGLDHISCRDRPSAHRISFAELWSDGLPARPGQQWYTSRFHLHLAAAARGAAGTALGIAPGYYGIKHRPLQELGTGWWYAGLEGLRDLPCPTADASFPDRCHRYAAAKQAEAISLYPPSAPPGPYGNRRAERSGSRPADRAGILVETNVRTIDAR